MLAETFVPLNSSHFWPMASLLHLLQDKGPQACFPVLPPVSSEFHTIQILASFFTISNGVWSFFPRLISQPEFFNQYSSFHSLSDFTPLYFLFPHTFSFCSCPASPSLLPADMHTPVPGKTSQGVLPVYFCFPLPRPMAKCHQASTSSDSNKNTK